MQLQTESAYITESDRKKLIYENEQVYIESMFHFMSDHNGPRPNCLHVLLSNSGTGKTTLIRSIITDIARRHRVFVWSSEEDNKDFKLGISRFYQSEIALKNITIFTELELVKIPKDIWIFLDLLESKMLSIRPHFVVIDNLTTSFIYDDNFKDQPAIIKRLIRMAKRLKCPVLVVAHTGPQIDRFSKKLISPEDARGKKQIVMESHFFYVMQQFEIENSKFTTIRVDKHRGQQIDTKMYRLNYSQQQNTFTGDIEISFAEFKEAYDSRNKL